jgi:hypothetical protein
MAKDGWRHDVPAFVFVAASESGMPIEAED